MRVRSVLVASALLVAACTEPKQTGLTGEWVEAGASSPSRQLYFGADGRFRLVIGFTGGEMTMILGAWTATDNRLSFVTEKKIDYDATGASTTTIPYVDTHFFEGATYTMTGDDTLTLTYVTYPADAPVTTTMTLYRLPPLG